MTPALVLVESNTSGTGPHFAEAARRRGADPVLVTSTPGRYPWAADGAVTTIPADTGDPSDVVRASLEASGGLPPAGVLSSSEYFVAGAAEVARRFGLPGADPQAVRRCREKAAQRAVLRAAGVAVPRTWAAISPAEAVRAADDLGYPVVCKPVDGTGSRGVRLCPDPVAVRSHVQTLLGGPADERGRPARGCVLVEEFVGGTEVSVETFGCEAVIVVDKHLGPLPSFVEHGHDVPSRLSLGDEAAVKQVAVEAVGALGLGWGPAHTEVRLTPAGPVVIEVNPRLAGGLIPVLVGLACGIDLVQATVDLALGRPGGPVLPAQPVRRGAAIRFVVARNSGRVQAHGDEAAARRIPGVADVALTAAPGDLVGGTGSFLDRIGWVIATGPSGDSAGRAADAAAALLAPDLLAFEAGALLAGAS